MIDDKKRHDIAVFRFGLIAPAANKTHTGTQAEYFRQVTQTELDVPHVGLVRYKPETLRRWLSAYRTGGFAALIPKPRSDVGHHRVITPEIEARIRELLSDHPRISAGKVRERLVDEGTITSKSPSESVIRLLISPISSLLSGTFVAPERKDGGPPTFFHPHRLIHPSRSHPQTPDP